MNAPAALLRTLRLLHLYTGIFVAPALLFFAFTGALQTFGLHESSRGSGYKPSHWIVVLSQIHKKQTTFLPIRRSPFPSEAQKNVSPQATPQATQDRPRPGDGTAAESQPGRPNPLPLKIFFLLVCIGLFTSTLTGIYMAYRYKRGPVLITGLLLAGLILPILLTFL